MMQSQGKITYEEYQLALETPIEVREGTAVSASESNLAPHYVESIRREYSPFLKDKDYDLYRDGLIIYTTLNKKIQEYANSVVENHIKAYQQKFDKKWNWNKNKKLESEIISKAIRKHPEYKSSPKSKREEVAIKLKKNKNFIDSVKNEKTTIQIGMVVIDPVSGAI